MFSACSQFFKCPANLLLVRSVYAENEHSISLKLISVRVSMEESGERRELQSERTNHPLMVWKQSLGLGQAGVRQKRGQVEEREALRAFKESSITWCLKQLVVSVLGTGHTSTSCEISLETQ